MSAESPGLVCIASAVSWFHPLFQRPHQLARAFARRGFEVLYVEPGFPGPESTAGPDRIEAGGGGITLWRFREELAPPSYHRFIDTSRRALFKLRWVTGPLGLRTWFDATLRPWLRDRLRERQLAGRIAAGSPAPRLLLLEYPETGADRLLRRAHRLGVTCVYDMLDDFQALEGRPDRARIEAALLASADVVLVTALALEPLARRRARHVVRVPNGVDPQHFQAARAALPRPLTWPCPGDGAPVIGYAGAIWDWFDVETLVGAARLRRDWRFVLVGMARPEIARRLAAEPNVHVVGPQPFAELPAWLAGFDVATVPFLCNDITRATNPVKVYEYLAAGRPVVSADLPEVRGFPHVEIADGAPAFVAAVARALATRVDLAAVDAFLASQTWDRRVAQILAASGHPANA